MLLILQILKSYFFSCVILIFNTFLYFNLQKKVIKVVNNKSKFINNYTEYTILILIQPHQHNKVVLIPSTVGLNTMKLKMLTVTQLKSGNQIPEAIDMHLY